MDLTPNDDQIALRTATADWCHNHLRLEDARARAPDLWPQLETMGWTGMTTPAMGLDHASEALVFAELGRVLAPIALVPSAVAARWAGVTGKVALALPATDFVRLFDGDGAQRALGLFGDDVGYFAIDDAASAPSLDLSTSVARIGPPAAIDRLADPRAALHLQLLAAAFAVGCADAARDMAADYAKIREQFERPIGWFQAIKHMCADMAVRCAAARAQLYYAACALDADDAEAAFHIAAAKRLADRAALNNGRANIQIHGGIGMTDEATPHLCLKRAHLLGFVAPARAEVLLAA
jgi:alkylation response protein AidB-like acyl-CoA dehydrogenase